MKNKSSYFSLFRYKITDRRKNDPRRNGSSECFRRHSLLRCGRAGRKLDTRRFENLMMKEKTVALPCEDPGTVGVSAAKPIIGSLSGEEKNRIGLLITCTESGTDFGKSISTCIHDYLGPNRNCRLFELRNACCSGTAGFQMALSLILSQTSPAARALVVTSDISRFMTVGGEAIREEFSFAEPGSGAGSSETNPSDH